MFKSLSFLLVSFTVVSSAFAVSPYDNIQAVGASNTMGVGSSVTLGDRIRYHLEQTVTDETTKKQLKAKKTLVAIDYFFPSNYEELDVATLDHRTLVFKILKEWADANDQVFVGLLPMWEDLNEREKSFAEYQEITRAYANILNVLAEPVRKKQAEIVNKAIREFAATNKKVKIIAMDRMVAVSLESFLNFNSGFNLTKPELNVLVAFNPDRFHFNDAGQALFLNNLLFPRLNKNIEPIYWPNLSAEQTRGILARTLLKKKDLIAGVNGGYWAHIADNNSFLVKNTVQNKSESPDFKLFSNIANSVQSFANSSDGFPIYISKTNSGKSLSLDLTKALFFVRVDLRQTGEDTFEGWGYDYWMTQGFAKTNYRFRARATKNPLIYSLEWTVFPIAPNQETPIIRVGLVPEEVSSYLNSHQEELPYLQYKLDISVSDL